MKKSLREQIYAFFRSLYKKSTLSSISTANSYSGAVVAATESRLDFKLGDKIFNLITHSRALQILNDLKKNGQSQSTLDKTRLGLMLFPKVKHIDRIKINSNRRFPVSRRYTEKQTHLITNRMSDRNSISARICIAAGLRAHELLTLAQYSERAPTNNQDIVRKQTNNIFIYQEDYARYTVIGKGGLCREIRLEPELAQELESRRLEQPVDRWDRGIRFRDCHYDLAGGKALTSSFSRISKNTLGWSRGVHGLRHTYAQNRYEYLIDRGHIDYEAKLIVSQELGHFRPEITEIYLR